MEDPRVRWGTEVVSGMIAGHPSLMYATRPSWIGEVLEDARIYDDRTYLVQGRRRMTFGEFRDAAGSLASCLSHRKVRPGDRVLLWGANGIDWVVGFWACLATGAVAVPGNTWWSESELAHAIATTEPVLAIADDVRLDSLPSDVPTVSFDEVRHVAGSAARGFTFHELRARSEDSPAIILFTSGTTGPPKGATLSHRAIVATLQNLLVASGRIDHLHRTDRSGPVSLLTLPLFHMGGMQALMTAMIAGGTVVFSEGRFKPDEVLRLIEQERVTVWGCVPTMLNRVLRCASLTTRDLSSLRSLAVGGAPVPDDLLQRAQQAFPNTRRGVGSSYGMSETGGLVASGSGADVVGRPHCVGKALPVAEIRIKDPDPSGVGELLARAPTVMDGYWGIDDDPILDAEGWIHSGDIGKIDDDGYVYVLDRAKDMIIRGGENIASAHVEAALRRHPAVEDVAVVGLPHTDLGEEVGAAIVPASGAVLDVEQLRRHAAAFLAHFEVPTRWRILDSPLPTSAVGKVLKRVIRDEWLRTEEDNRVPRQGSLSVAE